MNTIQLCERWLQGAPCFPELVAQAFAEIPGLELESDADFGHVRYEWAEGTELPHPITQNKVVDFLMEATLR